VGKIVQDELLQGCFEVVFPVCDLGCLTPRKALPTGNNIQMVEVLVVSSWRASNLWAKYVGDFAFLWNMKSAVEEHSVTQS
jgi:hypothetical protein